MYDHLFQPLHKRKYKSLTRPSFAGPWVTGFGGTQNLGPEIATPRSGGGFSSYFPRPTCQRIAVNEFLREARYPYRGLYYQYAPCRGLTFSYFVIFVALGAVATPISPRKRSVVVSTSTVFPMSRQARPVRFRCVFPYSLLLPLSVVQHPADCQCLDAAGIISLLNDYMIWTRPAEELHDKAPLGFLNPWLYSDEALSLPGLNDIVDCSNTGCGTRVLRSRAP